MKDCGNNDYDAELNMIQAVIAVLEGLGIACWIDQGTLLGLVRDGRLLPKDWDHDIDIGVWASQFFPRRKQACLTLNSMGFHVKQKNVDQVTLDRGSEYRPVSIAIYRRSGDRARKWYNSNQTRPSNTAFRMLRRLARIFEAPPSNWVPMRGQRTLHNLLVGRLFSILPSTIRLNAARFFRFVATENPSLILVQTPGKHFELCDRLVVDDVSLPIPSDTSGYLVLKYGVDWQMPRKEWNHLLDDGGVDKSNVT